MVKIRIQISRDLDLIKDTMDEIINKVISRNRVFLIPSDRGWVPAIDIYETEQEILILAELPGIDVDETLVILGDKHLKITGVRKEMVMKMKIHQMEIDFGKFERTIKLPVPVTGMDSSATYTDGFLVIRFKKV